MQERRATHILSSYYAPRGHIRMYSLGMQLAQMYLSPMSPIRLLDPPLAGLPHCQAAGVLISRGVPYPTMLWNAR